MGEALIHIENDKYYKIISDEVVIMQGGEFLTIEMRSPTWWDAGRTMAEREDEKKAKNVIERHFSKVKKH